MKKKVVFVAISGGVDSAVSAALLKKEGHEVAGVFMRTWHPEFMPCNEEEERFDAMRVASHLDIPFLTFDLEDEYKRGVADYMINEYKMGRTPNPDVMCNKEVKFGAFLKRALSMGADFIATGHYAQKFSSKEFLKLRLRERKDRGLTRFLKFLPESFLAKGSDPTKDQSYFLWTLKQGQLSKILFPIGGMKKSEVRKLAKKFGLPVAEKKDSQGICFLGEVDLKNFLKHYIKEKRGKVVRAEDRETIGFHNGVYFHTLGERHSFTITKKSPHDAPYYIVGKDVKKNILFVSNTPKDSFSSGPRFSSPKESSFSKKKEARPDHSEKGSFGLVILEDTNWIFEIPTEGKTYKAQVRYHGELLDCYVENIKPSKARVVFTKHVLVASGQSVVIYDGDVCLGGGIVV